jgi:hypothetical protein
MILTPSDRVTLTTEILTHLMMQDWSEIDFVLEEFGFPTAAAWSGDTKSYCLKMLRSGSDQKIMDLAKHYGNSFKVDEPFKEEPAFWADGQFRLFVSHLAAEKKYAAALQDYLAPIGISCFVAHTDITPTEEWQTAIEHALSTCDSLVALLHPNFHKSNWTDQEIGYAMGRHVPVFAVRLGEDPYGFIGKFQAFNGIGKEPQHIGSELFEAYISHKLTREKMAPILVSLFEKSTSYATAKRRIELLEKLAVWDDSFNGRLEKAIESNSQISGSWGTPDRVKALIYNWKKQTGKLEENEDIPF